MKRGLSYIGMTAFTLGLALLPLGPGEFFGSEGDWISQHVGAAENLRQMILSMGSLFPQYSLAGGGCNIYDYAYYGLYRPDVLAACAFPDIEMKYFIAGYAILCMVLSVNLCYLWLKRRHLEHRYALFAALLLACATCFFHAHHQIMFVNYMPYLILALMGIDRMIHRHKSLLMILGLTLICFHSFYYAPCCYVVCMLYGIDQLRGLPQHQSLQLLAVGLRNAVLSIGASAILLLPTALDILSTEKDAGAFLDQGVPLFDWMLHGLLFTPYGCGMTFVALIGLCISLKRRERRWLAAAILLAMTVPGVAWVLNGFLYARAKILIPFLPLAAWLCGDALAYVHRRLGERPVLPADGPRSKRAMRLTPLLLIVPLLSSLIASSTETYVPADDMRQSRFTGDEIAAVATDTRYRFDWLSNSFVNSNLLLGADNYKTAMYSSISNDLYSRFYYDTMGNPISLRNRVVLQPSQNPFFSYFMGIRYMQCHSSQVPEGHEEVLRKGNYLLAENPDVLPIAYGTDGLLSADAYEGLPFPMNIEALTSYAVVADQEAASAETPRSHMTAHEPAAFFSGEIKPGVYALPLKQTLDNQILIIRFAVENAKGKAVDITINGVKNTLSDESAPYPNHNDRFTYIFACEDGTDALEIEASQGEWTVNDLEVYTMNRDDLGHETVYLPEETKEKSASCMFACGVDMKEAGYFITSFPYREGYQVMIDGERYDYELVNTAFVGFPLGEGLHDVEINYEAPGFALGRMLTLLSLIGCVVVLIGERKRER